MTPFFQLDPKIESASAAALQQVAPRFTEIDEVTEYSAAPGDKMLCVSGMPYDTLHSVIGLTGENMGSLKDYGIAFDCVPLKEEHLDYEAIAKAVDDTVTMVYIQRSRGYELRASLF